MDGPITEALTFDDVLLLPGRSSVLPNEVDTRTWLTRKLQINVDRQECLSHRPN